VTISSHHNSRKSILSMFLRHGWSVIWTVPLTPSPVAAVEVGKLLGRSAEIGEQSA
jgi:hypothetical protein